MAEKKGAKMEAEQPCGPAVEMAEMMAEAAMPKLSVGTDYMKAYYLMNSKPFYSKTHGKQMVNFYANEVGRAAAAADSRPFPVGTVIVKTGHGPMEGAATEMQPCNPCNPCNPCGPAKMENPCNPCGPEMMNNPCNPYNPCGAMHGVTKIFVMEKRAAGYDPDNGDWYYAFAKPDWTLLGEGMDGKVQYCVGCHDAGAAENDYVYGVPADVRTEGMMMKEMMMKKDMDMMQPCNPCNPCGPGKMQQPCNPCNPCNPCG